MIVLDFVTMSIKHCEKQLCGYGIPKLLQVYNCKILIDQHSLRFHNKWSLLPPMSVLLNKFCAMCDEWLWDGLFVPYSI